MWFFNFGSDKKEDTNTTPSHSVETNDVGNNVIMVKATKANKTFGDDYKDGNGKLAKSTEENYFHISELVFSCVDYIGKAASQAIPKIYKVDPKTGDKKPVKDKKLLKWAMQPNEFWSWGDTIELTVQGLLLSGTSYLTFENNKGNYESWFLTPPSKVSIVPDKSKYIKGIIFDEKIAYKVEEVCIIRNPTLNNPYYGVPAVRPLLDTLTLESDSINELKTFYEGSNILGGVIQSELPLNPDQIENLREQFDKLYGKGGSKRRGTAVLPSKMEYKTVQANPKDAMLLESLDVSEQRVLRVFKINSLVLGGESTSTTHPQELMKVVYNTAVRPYLYKIQDSMTMFLRKKFKDDNIVFEFDLDRVVELDTSLDVKASSSKTLYATGVASLNEARNLVGLPKIDAENADKNVLAAYLFGDNFTYIQDAGKEPPAGSGTSTSTPSGSTNPQGGTADNPAGSPNNNSNNSD